MASSNSEIVIEFATEKQHNVYFPPLARLMRGRIDFTKLPRIYTDPNGALTSCPPIPGQQMMLDPLQARVLIADPLGFHENEQVFSAIKKTCAAINMGNDWHVAPPEVQAKLTAKSVATIWWWMRKLVEEEPYSAVLVSGKFAAQPKGRVQVDFSHIPHKNAEGRLVLPKFLDELRPDEDDIPSPMPVVS